MLILRLKKKGKRVYYNGEGISLAIILQKYIFSYGQRDEMNVLLALIK